MRPAAWWGVLRSLAVYWRPGRQGALRRFYRPFVGPGDLVFDIGAHLGDRSAAFAALGARVLALEPQPHMARWLERLVGHRPGVTVLTEAVGSEIGTGTLALSRRTPTVSTLAASWRDALTAENPSFRGVSWDEAVEVPVTTLDALIERHGVPDFCKIDVEGYEAEVLAGLTRPLAALSVEFVSGALDVAVACVERLDTLGAYQFNAVPGESRNFHHPTWQTPASITSWLEKGASGFGSGDLYARLDPSKP